MSLWIAALASIAGLGAFFIGRLGVQLKRRVALLAWGIAPAVAAFVWSDDWAASALLAFPWLLACVLGYGLSRDREFRRG